MGTELELEKDQTQPVHLAGHGNLAELQADRQRSVVHSHKGTAQFTSTDTQQLNVNRMVYSTDNPGYLNQPS